MADTDEGDGGGLHVVSPAGPLYRIARSPDPWAWPDWAHVGTDGTFGNRWDDPESLYRVVYASSSRLGAFIEVLARFRPDPHIVAAMEEISDDSSAEPRPPGELDVSWPDRRCVGEASVITSKAAICDRLKSGHSQPSGTNFRKR